MRIYWYIILLVLLAFKSEALAQILWKHVTSDVWINPQTQEVDSSICFTALSCYGDNCTAAAILFNYPINPVGRIAFYRSNNGGLSWNEQPQNLPNEPPDITNWGMTRIQQIDSVNAVASGRSGVIIRTTDGGTTWRRIDSPAKNDILDIHFSNPLTGIITCTGADSAVFTTLDGGDHWVYHQFSSFPSCHSYGNGKFRLFAYGHGPILTTNDNFQTIDTTDRIFDSITDPKYHNILGRCAFGNGDTIFALGNYVPRDSLNPSAGYGMIMRSIDGGQSWEEPWISPYNRFSVIREISHLDRDTIFAAGGYNHYIMSTDRGRTWSMDTVVLDTNYSAPELCLGMSISKDGHPVAVFGNSGFRVTSIITRGEHIPSAVEGIERIKYNTHFYPNPTTGIVNIESIYKAKSPLVILDIFGNVLVRSMLTAEGKATLNLSQLAHGIYYVVFDVLGRKFIAGKILVVD